jgi:hypothetical protein
MTVKGLEITMRYLKRSLFIMFTLTAGACASSGSNAAAEERRQETATVVVDNRALLDMTIYALRGAQRVRLGTAAGLSKTKLNIPASLVYGATSLRFIADPIGGNRSPVSEEIAIQAGDEIGLTIPPY